ncbi:hypothetical protein AUQ42_00625 [Thalassospira sp. MCCC 1A02491]|nr:hypothetical protein AUQ42_00625 [Thalassospira sp. MCCC 1A02491]
MGQHPNNQILVRPTFSTLKRRKTAKNRNPARKPHIVTACLYIPAKWHDWVRSVNDQAFT